MNQKPLRYNISSWNQLTQCMSNNSRDLSISVSEIVQDDRFSGTIIRVEHRLFGVLFACTVDSSGPLLTPGDDGDLIEFTTEQILKELAKFGFIVTYCPMEHLDGDQVQYLLTLNQLGFQKIRTMYVYKYDRQGIRSDDLVIVAFNIEPNPKWLDNGYSPHESEYLEALNNGSAINISAISKDKKFRWDWLTFVANIRDIIKDNA